MHDLSGGNDVGDKLNEDDPWAMLGLGFLWQKMPPSIVHLRCRPANAGPPCLSSAPEDDN